MRYWIWWNDLTQGPFELDELTALKAFSEDLLVCMEDRQDWIPASRVADLSSAIEQYRVRQAAPRVPPPPPPKRPPSSTPLQGEFFADPPNQSRLLELETEGSPNELFAYRSVTGDFESPPASFLIGRVTMPFHFLRQPAAQAAVIEIPRPEPPLTIIPAQAIILESTIPVEDVAPIVRLEALRDDVLPEPQNEPQSESEYQVAPSVLPPMSFPYEDVPGEKKLTWLPWILGVALALGAVGSLGYWLVDRASTRSAMSEAKRLESLQTQTPSPSVQPVTPMPVPAAPVIARPSATQKKLRQMPAKIKKVLAIWVDRTRQLFKGFKSKGQSTASAPVATAPTSQEPAPDLPARASKLSYSAPSRTRNQSSSSVPAKVARYAMDKSKRASAAAKKKPSSVTHAVPAPAAAPTAPPALPESSVPAPALPGVAPTPAAGDEIPAQATSASADSPVVIDIPVPVDSPESVAAAKPDPWKGKQNEAIALVMNKPLPKSKLTVGSQAKTMLHQMREKEMIHAAETGERLYLPDKLVWAALQEDGSVYRVYLNFMGWQASGERVQSRSYQFAVDLKRKSVSAHDTSTQQDLLGQPLELTFKHNPMSTDIESILGGVDTYNKHKVQLIIIKNSRRNREDRKKIESAMALAQSKVQRAVVYFRKTYAAQKLENLAKAYQFTDMLKG